MALVASRSGRRSASAVAAWAAATAAAAGVAWLGVDSVLIPAAETPPAVLAAGASPTRTPAPASSSAAPSPGTAPAIGAAPSRSAAPRTSAPATASPPASPSPTDTGKLSRYQTGGGVVVLSIGAHTVALVSATPAAGYSVQNWSASGWLRVDFTEGSTVYSVYATWNGYSPQVQVVGPN